MSVGAEDGALAEAQATIARQAEELERLRRRLGEERLAEELRDALALAGTAGAIAAPVSHARLLELIMETAAAVIGARAGALFLIDEAAQELTFEVAIGPKAAEVKKFRVPLGHGIAGLVAVSGQPMAVSDASNDPRQAADIARDVGYAPGSSLAVPLVAEERVIGVLELLDKEGAASFSPDDIATLGLFAQQAGVAVEQSGTRRRLTGLLGGVLGGLGAPMASRSDLNDRAGAFADGVEADPAYEEALSLAGLVQEIVSQGERERTACRALLEGFAGYLRARPSATGWGVGLGEAR
ncbi:MAG: GAF domain-containing protein [Chloroflexota bacterium]|nr:GAF domain-containing protein [Chloroflexota bacterium]